MCESAFCVTFSVKVLFISLCCLSGEGGGVSDFSTVSLPQQLQFIQTWQVSYNNNCVTRHCGAESSNPRHHTSTQRITNIITDNQGFKK